MQAEFRRALENCDVAAVRGLWAVVSPHLPQPKTDAEALVIVHHARTQTESLPFKARAYSHAWLTERGYPTGLPDALRPKAERMYPRVVGGVGISVNVSEHMRPVGVMVRKAMESAVMEAEADGKLDDVVHVRARMQEARFKKIRELF